MSILDLRGPEFLQVYLTLLAGAVVASLVLRRLMRGPFEEHPSWRMKLGALEVAYLAGGARGATDAAITSLVHRDVLRVQGSSPPALAAAATPPHDLAPLEQVVYDAAAGKAGETVANVRRAALEQSKRVGSSLEAHELVLPSGRAALVRLVPVMLLLSVLTLGIAKVMIGLSRGRPIQYLVVLCFVTLILIVVFAARYPHRTIRGDKFLKRLKREHAALEATASAAPSRLAYGDLALAFALFGPVVLAHDELLPLHRAMKPPNQGGSGCGGASCGSGGGSCGGSCGGGCGGCGGD